MQPESVHQPVEKESRPRHVSGVFKQSQAEKEKKDVRQEHDHASDPTDDTVDEERAKG